MVRTRTCVSVSTLDRYVAFEQRPVALGVDTAPCDDCIPCG